MDELGGEVGVIHDGAGLLPRALRPAGPLTVVVPDDPGRATVHHVIYDELVRGIVSRESRHAYLEVIDQLIERGAIG